MCAEVPAEPVRLLRVGGGRVPGGGGAGRHCPAHPPSRPRTGTTENPNFTLIINSLKIIFDNTFAVLTYGIFVYFSCCKLFFRSIPSESLSGSGSTVLMIKT